VSEHREATPFPGGDPAPDATSEPGTTTTAVTPPKGAAAVSPSTYRRLTSGMAGMTVAMLACLAVGLLIVLTPRRNHAAMPRVDYSSDLTGLISTAPYQVLAPEGLPQRWYPTSSRLSGNAGGPVSWHLGYNTPSGEYAALEESNETPDGAGHFIDRMTSQGRPDGTAQVAGATWAKTFRPDKKQHSLVRRLPGVTIVLTGTASYDELAVLAGSLKPQTRPTSGATPVH
jgi:Protein of unknown function (DUF4245)